MVTEHKPFRNNRSNGFGFTICYNNLYGCRHKRGGLRGHVVRDLGLRGDRHLRRGPQSLAGVKEIRREAGRGDDAYDGECDGGLASHGRLLS